MWNTRKENKRNRTSSAPLAQVSVIFYRQGREGGEDERAIKGEGGGGGLGNRLPVGGNHLILQNLKGDQVNFNV